MKKYNKLLIACLGLGITSISLWGCGDNKKNNTDDKASSNDTPAQTEPKNTDYLLFSADKFVIEYPKDWDKQEKYMMTTVFLKSPLKKSNDIFAENLSVIEEPLGKTFSLDEYTDASVKTLNSMYKLKDLKKEDFKSTTGKKFKQITYNMTQGTFYLKIRQYLFVDGKNGYIFTYSAMNDNFSEYEKTIETMLNSFNLK